MSRKTRNPNTAPPLTDAEPEAPGTVTAGAYPAGVNPSDMSKEEYEAWKLDHPPLPARAGNGNGSPPEERPNDLPAEHEQDTPAGDRRPKRPSEVFYLLVGRSKDGTCVDVLGEYGTRNRAEKALDAMGLAVKRHYMHVKVFQCRDKSAA